MRSIQLARRDRDRWARSSAALLAWAVVRGEPDGWLRQLVIAASGVLAQFGGVMLAFAFLATFGFNGLVTIFCAKTLDVDILSDSTWLYGMTGLAVVYTYFQIPLMVIVFLPALDGLRQEWYDASASLGGSSWSFWRHVGGPILAPSFLGAVLLLFANAFSAYATAAALVSQGSPIVAAPDPRGDDQRGRPGPGERRQGAGARHDRGRRRRDGAVRPDPARASRWVR